MRDSKAHSTALDRRPAAASRDAVFGSNSTSLQTRQARSMDAARTARSSSRHTYSDMEPSGGCVPSHRSMFRIFRRKTHTASAVPRISSTSANTAANANTVANANTSGSASMSSSSEHGGYVRTTKLHRSTGPAGHSRASGDTAIATVSFTGEGLPASTRFPLGTRPPQSQPRHHKVGRGTIVQLGSSSEKRVTIPALNGLHTDIVSASSTTSTRTEAAPAASRSPEGSGPARPLARGPIMPRRSSSASDMHNSYNQIRAGLLQMSVSDDELASNHGAELPPHVQPDDSSDWNSDFSSPSSHRRSSDRPVSINIPQPIDGSRLKDRAIDRGVLEAQRNILQQEKCLMQISNLSSCLALLRPSIMRCLVFELPDRGIQIGTSTFVSAIREPCGSVEPSVEEERLWELWRQAEALLTIMDNNNIPLSTIESRISLSKKRAIMLAFCDWEQYSAYVQDAWDKACRGIPQPDIDSDLWRSNGSSNDASKQSSKQSSTRSSNASSIANGHQPGGPVFSAGAGTRQQRRSRRRSIVGVAPGSLQRIADEAQSIKQECEQLLELMSPMYRETQAGLKDEQITSTEAAIAATAAATAEIDALTGADGAHAMAFSSGSNDIAVDFGL
ncbi:hypothetical protein GQ54DRAFT_295758 [Martensiomyces pterosporus]|nr:hypothetical protein GQ54DRAFT_295758 [Martensiomyces pterosporus]